MIAISLRSAVLKPLSFNFENIFYIPFIKSGVLLTKYIIFTLHTYCLYENIFYKIIKNYKFHNSLDYIYIYNGIIIFLIYL